MPIMGRPMLELQIERIRRSILIDDVIIATSTSPKDDAIARLADRLGVSCYRGSEDDVLLRVVETLEAHEVDLHAEFMGDNPLPDPMLVDSVIGFYLKHADEYDYVSNALKTTYPPGAEVFVYPAEVLIDAEKYAVDPKLREHVGLHIYQNESRYRICNVEAPAWFNFPEVYLEVDTPEDFEVVSQVYEHLYHGNPAFGLMDVLGFMRAHPELASRNSRVERRWKAFRRN
jgi:spore coat polysaccharide biosynthesis protein SpsF